MISPLRVVGMGLCVGSAVALAGCLTGRAAPPVSGSLADDLREPRVTRMQQGEPVKPPVLPGGPAQATFRPPLPSEQDGPPSSRIKVRAWVDGKPILDEDVVNAMMSQMNRLQNVSGSQRDQLQAELFNKTLAEIIDDEIIHQEAVRKLEKLNPRALGKLKEAAKEEFDKHLRTLARLNRLEVEELKDRLKKSGVSLDVMKTQTERKMIATEYMRSQIFKHLQVGRPEMERYYQEHLNEFQRLDSVTWENIFVAVGPKHPTAEAARRTAEQVLARWRSGADVKDLKDYDDGDSCTRGGAGYGARRGEIRPAQLEDYLFRLKDGDFGPPVDIGTGVHLFRLVHREYAGQIPFNEETQKVIRTKLRNQIAEREYKQILRELKSRAIVEIERN